jgi:hypothetical protein
MQRTDPPRAPVRRALVEAKSKAVDAYSRRGAGSDFIKGNIVFA